MADLVKKISSPYSIVSTSGNTAFEVGATLDDKLAFNTRASVNVDTAVTLPLIVTSALFNALLPNPTTVFPLVDTIE